MFYLNKSIRKLPWVLILSICVSCITKPETASEVALKTLRVDLDSDDKVKATDIFERPYFIPLESSDSSLLSKIGQLKVTKNYIFILEGQPDRRVFIFNRAGELVYKSGYYGRGPNEFHGAKSIAVDKDESKITYMEVLGKPKLVTLGVDGLMIKSRNQKLTRFAAGGFNIIQDYKTGNYIIDIVRLGDVSKNRVINTKLCIYDDKNSTMHPAVLNTLGYEGMLYINHLQLYRFRDDIYFKPANWDTIYKVINTRAHPFYHLDYGKYSKPTGINSANSMEDWKSKAISKQNYVLDHNFIIETDNYHIGVFRIRGKGSALWINDKQKHTSITIKEFANDWIAESSYTPYSLNDMPREAIIDTLILIHNPVVLKRNLRNLEKKLTDNQFARFKELNPEFINLVNELEDADNPILGFYPIRKDIIEKNK